MRMYLVLVGLFVMGWTLLGQPALPAAHAQAAGSPGPTFKGLPLGSWTVVVPPHEGQGPFSGRLVIALSGVSWLLTERRHDAVLQPTITRPTLAQWRFTWAVPPWPGGATTWEVTRVPGSRDLRLTPLAGQSLQAVWHESVRGLPDRRTP